MTDKSNEDGSVLDPEDLDITNDERVVEIDDDRFVISAGDGQPNSPPEPPDYEDEPSDADVSDAGAETVNGNDVSRWLARSFAGNGFRYGFDATLDYEGEVNRHRMVSNDVVATFETLVLWYARHVDEETPPEEVLGILLAEADTPVEYPVRSVHALLDRYDLSPEDSLADLVAAVAAEGGLSVSPP